MLCTFNYLWFHNFIPSDWKKDCLVPILKQGKTEHEPDSYRPIALTSCIGKIFEQLLKQRLEFFVEKYCILPNSQFGFRKGRSAQESISHLQLDIYNAVSCKRKLACIFFDIVGAFNNVNLATLSNELASIGLPGKIINWIYTFLNGRQVYVKYNNSLIGPRLSHKGTCQGSILSPLIFLLYINRITAELGPNVNTLQYTDDLAIYCSGPDLNAIKMKLSFALINLKK